MDYLYYVVLPPMVNVFVVTKFYKIHNIENNLFACWKMSHYLACMCCMYGFSCRDNVILFNLFVNINAKV